MRSSRRWLARGLPLAIPSVLLLKTGACLQITQDAVIGGFFNAATPVMIEHLQERWLPADSGDQTNNAGTGGTP